MLREGTCLVTETAFFDDLPFSVHDAVAAHLVAQVNTDRLLRHLLPRFAKLLHGWLLLCTSSSAFHSLSLSKAGQPSHPIYFEIRPLPSSFASASASCLTRNMHSPITRIFVPFGY